MSGRRTIAVIGSRDYVNLGAVADFVRFLPFLEDRMTFGPTSPEKFDLVTGGARGVDQVVYDVGLSVGYRVAVVKPSYDRYNRRLAPLKRNEVIASLADRMVAFWDEKSGGTSYAIAFMRALGRAVEVRTASRRLGSL